MIVQENYWTENIEALKAKSHYYMVLDTSIYRFTKDKDMLETGIQIAHLSNALRVLNISFAKLEFKPIDFKILGEVLTSIYSDKPMDLEKLEELFEFERNLEETCLALQTISPFMEELFIPSSVIMHLIGFSFEKQNEFLELDKKSFGFLDEEFFNMHNNQVLEGKMNASDFKELGLELMANGLKKAKFENKK